jgi:hypothetical protein
MRSRIEGPGFALVLGFFVISIAGVSGLAPSTAEAAANTGTFTTFDPPGSVETVPYAINPGGVITGPYYDAAGGNTPFCGRIAAP